jgi:hypothetical protein
LATGFQASAFERGTYHTFLKAAREGRDVRAVTALFDRLYAERQLVEVPRTLDEVRALRREKEGEGFQNSRSACKSPLLAA